MKRNDIVNPGCSDKMRELHLAALEYAQRLGQAAIGRSDCGHNDSTKHKTSREIPAKNIFSRFKDPYRIPHHHPSGINHAEQSLYSINEEHYLSTTRQVEYEHLGRGNNLWHPFVTKARKYDSEETVMSDNWSRKINLDLYEVVDPIRHVKIGKDVSGKLSNEDHRLDLIQELDLRSQRKRDEWGLYNLRSPQYGRHINHSLQIKQQTPGRTAFVEEVGGNSADGSKTFRDGSFGNEKYRIFSNAHAQGYNERRTFNCGKSVRSENKGDVIKKFHTTDNYDCPPDIMPVHTDSNAHTPFRYLQRPERAKRMDLHKPELLVIPEVGEILYSSDSVESARRDMLSSLPLFSRTIPNKGKRFTGRKEKQNKRNTSNLLNKRMPQNVSHESSNSTSGSCYLRDDCVQSLLNDVDIDRLAATKMYTFLPRDTSGELKKITRHNWTDFPLPSNRRKKK